ncbi:MAG: helix-turn-helix transcriptional regulator [Acidobacteria bacterium]|nr:helix-turn-helix transcriptional regulator [Acidobacteriota bacterium]
MELLKPKEAAQLAGVSILTIKRWIYDGKIKSVQTAGGHHRIPRREIERITSARSAVTVKKAKTPKAIVLESISGRNKLRGQIISIRFEGLLAQASIDVGGQVITSIITSDAARALGLKKGATVYALIKATEVMIIKD